MIDSASDWMDKEALRQNLEPILTELGSEGASIAKIYWRRSRLSTSFETGVITVQLRDGSAVKIFLKNYDKCARRRWDSHQRGECEVNVYKHLLLPKGTLGTAAYYGSVWDDIQQRHWLLLEYVEGTPARYLDVEHWIEAAGWLGRIHGQFAKQTARLGRWDWLARHDADYFHGQAENALRCVADVTPHLRPTFQPIVDAHARLITDMVSPPFTLSHGSYNSANAIICPSSDPMRVCVIDWEKAGLGSPYYDLAHLVDGFDRPVLDRFLQRYSEGAGQFGMSTPTYAHMRYLVNCFRLHAIFKLLSQSVLKEYSEPTMTRLVAQAQQRYEETRTSAYDEL